MVPRSSNAPLVCSFPPIAAPAARVLVLGTAPSIASLARQQYYGHPQNAFWPIMGRLFGAERELPYDERRRIVTSQGVAIWDVLRECYREGSLDTSIHLESESPNDIAGFLRSQPLVHSVFFNGGKAESAFRRHALPLVTKLEREFRYTRLPSTSPAHAGRTFVQKLAAWRAISRAAAKELTTETQRTRRRNWSLQICHL